MLTMSSMTMSSMTLEGFMAVVALTMTAFSLGYMLGEKSTKK